MPSLCLYASLFPPLFAVRHLPFPQRKVEAKEREREKEEEREREKKRRVFQKIDGQRRLFHPCKRVGKERTRRFLKHATK